MDSCIVGVLAAAAAAAQEAPPATDASVTESELEVVVVTGSRIRRTEFDSVAPMLVLTREETTMAGFSSLSESLQSTSITGGSSQINNAFGGFVTDGGPGANTISLRGLGASRTLVLLNGRRLAPAGSRGSVGTADLNVLPSSMVERIDVLRDGASSIYGSDAIAGVVNIITRREPEGTTIEGQYNGTEDGGGAQTRFSISSGLTGDRYAVSGSVEYFRRQDLTLADREWTRCNQDYLYFNDDGSRSDFIDPLTGKYKCYPITDTGSNGVTINTIGTVRVPGVPGPATVGTTFNRWRPNSAVTEGLVGFEGVSLDSRDTFEKRMLNESLISPVETYTGFFEGRYDLQALGNAELYGEALITRRDSEQFGYRQLALDYAPGSLLLPSSLNELGISGYSDIAPDGYAVRAFIGFGNDHSTQTVDFTKATVGLRGDFVLDGWRYDAYASYSKSDAEYTFQSFLIDSMYESLDVVAAPVGTPEALVRNGLTCRANLTNPSLGCIPAPALSSQTVGGVLPQDWVRNVWHDITGQTEYDETVVSATFDGPLFDLPAGSVSTAIGLEYRDASIDDTPAEDSRNSNLYGFTSSAITRGSDSVWEVYAEVELPLLKDLPAAQELTLNLSGRYTEYDSYGDDTTYKATLSWVPLNWLSVRGTYGTSYRAPALFEQFQGATTGFISNANDPCNDYGEGDPTSARYQNCAAEGLPPDFQATSSLEIVTVGGADAGLAAETSDNFTAGIILQPVMPDNWGSLALAIDYYDIQIDNGVTQAGATSILDLCYDDPDFRAGGGYCNLIDERYGNNQLRVYDSYINLSSQVVEGIDYNARYSRDLGDVADLLVNLRLSQFLAQEYKLFQTDPWEDTNGTIGAPEWSGELDVSVGWNSWTVRYATEWVGSMDSYEFLFGEKTNRAETGYDFAVPDYFLHHLSAQYMRDDEWSVTFGVRNVADETPPIIGAGYYNRVGNSPLYSGYDYVGRQFFVSMAYSF